MAKSRPSVQKRKREARLLEKKMAKEARKASRDAERAARADDVEEGIDPDLAGIVAGPQEKPWAELVSGVTETV